VDRVEIRRATEADLELMHSLWDTFTREATFTPYPGSPFDPSLVVDDIALVAEEGEAVLGTVYTNTSSPDFGYVFGLYVVPEARRRGIARALMREVARILRDQGRAYVVLTVDTPNEEARALYAELGFEDAGRSLRAEVGQLVEDADELAG
jgi:ribosomal protein S18 acetylase RimI-like enzyme